MHHKSPKRHHKRFLKEVIFKGVTRPYRPPPLHLYNRPPPPLRYMRQYIDTQEETFGSEGNLGTQLYIKDVDYTSVTTQVEIQALQVRGVCARVRRDLCGHAFACAHSRLRTRTLTHSRANPYP